jgi:hypothetical protein
MNLLGLDEAAEKKLLTDLDLTVVGAKALVDKLNGEIQPGEIKAVIADAKELLAKLLTVADNLIATSEALKRVAEKFK